MDTHVYVFNCESFFFPLNVFVDSVSACYKHYCCYACDADCHNESEVDLFVRYFYEERLHSVLVCEYDDLSCRLVYNVVQQYLARYRLGDHCIAPDLVAYSASRVHLELFLEDRVL